MEFEFMTADTVLPPCMPLPTAILRLPVSSTAKVMYARLLDATFAASTEDTNGILFVRFPIVELAAGTARRKDTGTPDEAAYPEGTDASALYQRGYAGKFPDKAGSADGR